MGTVLVTQENRGQEGGALLTCVNAIRFRFGELARPRFLQFRFRFGFRRTVLALAAAAAADARNECRSRGDLNILPAVKNNLARNSAQKHQEDSKLLNRRSPAQHV